MIVIHAECPFCGMKGKGTSELDHIYMARRTCAGCNQELLIVDDKPINLRTTEGATPPVEARYNCINSRCSPTM
jgi:hypothetical protein